MNDYDLLLLLTDSGLLEAVVDPSLTSGDRQVVAPTGGTRAHTSTSLLLLQVLRPKVARLGIQHHRGRYLLRRLLEALLIPTKASSCQRGKGGLLITETVEDAIGTLGLLLLRGERATTLAIESGRI
jgi:hypothetical protein